MFSSQLVQAKYTFITIPPPPTIENNNTSTDLNLLTPYYGDLDYVEKAYGHPLAVRNYQVIPTDYERFIELYNLLIAISEKTTRRVNTTTVFASVLFWSPYTIPRFVTSRKSS